VIWGFAAGEELAAVAAVGLPGRVPFAELRCAAACGGGTRTLMLVLLVVVGIAEGTGKTDAGLFEEVAGGVPADGILGELFAEVGEGVPADGVPGNRRVQVAGPTIPSAVKPEACWNRETAIAVLSP